MNPVLFLYGTFSILGLVLIFGSIVNYFHLCANVKALKKSKRIYDKIVRTVS
jgi:phage-related holin